ncbi:fumarylacetoacetate hydrolase family protein [Cohnella zeiphila]|uniref:fumarylacetoacetate hydrolase family protein n=1 Tax=Cohnella zeiphila TaxID=2761120 RepID=UPI001EE23350|nr:fumarylacetoacetate hydrolase family protein [Cohnella zeiphila]
MTTYVRFATADDSTVRGGVLDGDVVREYTGCLFDGPSLAGRADRLTDVVLKAPLEPRHIIGIGKNFAAEGAAKPDAPELPILFFKPQTAVIGPGEPIVAPPGVREVQFEAELAVVIGKRCRDIRPEDADSHIFGFTVANDVAVPGFFHPDGHWTIGKSFDTFCPLGPVLVTSFDYRNAGIQSRVNGAEKQNSSIERIILPIDRMIAYISRFMTLQPGDVLLTGTPAGAGAVRDGDIVECRIEGIGSLVNPVRSSMSPQP